MNANGICFSSLKDVLSIGDVAEAQDTTRQAVYLAIKNGKLAAEKVGGKFKIKKDKFLEFVSNKYSRKTSKLDGELIFDKSKGLYSVREAASLLSIPDQKIYYCLRIGRLKGERAGCAWVINIDELRKSRLTDRDDRKCNF